MKYSPNQIYHVFNQGNNKQKIFFEEKNYIFFLKKIRKHILPYADILCYCLMPNHFHLLLTPNKEASSPSKAIKPRNKYGLAAPIIKDKGLDHQEKLSQSIGTLLSSYTKAINKAYNRSGSLFRGKTKVKNEWAEGWITVDGSNKHLFFRKNNDYARQCFHYIHENPVKAKLSELATDWPYSSAQDYAGLRSGTLCNQILAKKVLEL